MGEVRMNVNDMLSTMYMQNNALLNALNPETISFYNIRQQIIANCPYTEREHDMSQTFVFCKLTGEFCNGQCITR